MGRMWGREEGHFYVCKRVVGPGICWIWEAAYLIGPIQPCVQRVLSRIIRVRQLGRELELLPLIRSFGRGLRA
jgi:hypothetical protein